MARATVVGAGPNGLAAAITLASAGVETTLYEANGTVGGACRSEELTLPGFVHDVGSSAYPVGVASPFFASLPLGRYGHRWVQPEAAVAHPLDDGTAVMLEHDLVATCEGLGRADGMAYRGLMREFVGEWPALVREILGPVPHWPRSPLVLARFGTYAVLPAATLARSAFRGERGRALFAGLAAHSVRPLTSALSAAVGLVLGAAGHTTGWPVVEGGAGRLTDALAAHFESLGGVIRLNSRVQDLGALPGAEVTLCDVTPRQLVGMAGERMPAGYRKQLQSYKYGPGTFKVDWALREPIPWRAKECLRAATVHVGGTLEEMIASEAAPWRGKTAERPFVLLVQPSLFDATRAPEGGHTAWGYCHVPHGAEGSMLEAIEAQVERFAPGFRECVVARRVMGSSDLEAWDANLVGGDLSGGAMTPWQMVMRPTPSLYTTGMAGVYLCSSSTPPGGGVHGMCGVLAAKRALEWM